jgi:insertion element IS1 protein InsB
MLTLKTVSVDRNRGEIVDWQVTKRRDFNAYYKMAQRLEKRYRINYLCSDKCPIYGKYLISKHYVITKAETCLVEATNSLIRHYLARFHRKTKRHSKAFDMIEASLLLFFNRRQLPSFVV